MTQTTTTVSPPTVLSIGQCRMDQAAISHYLMAHFGARVLNADLPEHARKLLASEPVALVLINRKLDADGSDGLEILSSIRSGADQPEVPVMLVSNYPEWQQTAVERGAVYGFGKAEMNRPETRTRLAAVLSPAAVLS
jgi:response regulator RpfG family c-di-GMP phosphodiesterase